MFREYIAVVKRHFGNFIAGPIVGAFGLLAAFIGWKTGASPEFVKWTAWISLAVFPLSIFPAQYYAWKDERLELEKERAKNEKPEIGGEAWNFKVGIKGPSVISGKSYFGAQVYFAMRVCNSRQVKTSVRDVILDGSNLNPPVKFYRVQQLAEYPSPAGMPQLILDHGIHKDIPCAFQAEMEGEPKNVILDNLIIELVDGFGVHHSIQTRAGESLAFRGAENS